MKLAQNNKSKTYNWVKFLSSDCNYDETIKLNIDGLTDELIGSFYDYLDSTLDFNSMSDIKLQHIIYLIFCTELSNLERLFEKCTKDCLAVGISEHDLQKFMVLISNNISLDKRINLAKSLMNPQGL